MKQKVTIIETLERVIEVDAPTKEDAIDMVSDDYYNCKYVLDAEDFRGVDFE